MDHYAVLCQYCSSIFDWLGESLEAGVKKSIRERLEKTLKDFTAPDTELGIARRGTLDFDARIRRNLYTLQECDLGLTSANPEASPQNDCFSVDSDNDVNIKFKKRSVDYIQKSASSCQLCNLVNSLIVEHDKRIPDLPAQSVDIHLILDVAIETGMELERLDIVLCDKNDQVADVQHLEVWSVKAARWKSILGSTTLVSPVEKGLAWLRNCITRCIQYHEECRQDYDATWLPTRLIDTGESKHQSIVRLVSGANLIKDGYSTPHYASLSHKWGTTPFLNLTSSNMNELKTGILLSSLPQTFKHVIMVTRQLGIQYLWIDSICILQDSLQDWQKESSLMDRVYRNAVFNLAASESLNPRHGLSAGRYPLLWTPLRIRVRSYSLDEDHFVFHDRWNTVIEDSPLSKRGWVVQERLLSPRTIHFASPIFWECRRLVACETYPYGLQSRLTHKIWYGLPCAVTQSDPLYVWEGVLQTYARCTLSHTKDKLVAISGIARVMHSFIMSEYLAGVWKEHLVRGLLWFIEKDAAGYAMPYARQLHYVAPSWSWASIDGPIDFTWQRCLNTPLVDILHAETTPATDDIFGQVVGGLMKLRGRLFPVGPLGQFADLIFTSFNPTPYCLAIEDMDTSPSWSEDAFLLPLVSLKPEGWAEDCSLYCLLLTPIKKGRLQFYERRGFALLNEEGGIANSGYVCPGWTRPPWPRKDRKTLKFL